MKGKMGAQKVFAAANTAKYLKKMMILNCSFKHGMDNESGLTASIRVVSSARCGSHCRIARLYPEVMARLGDYPSQQSAS
jgi:hypothetical protein